MYYRKLGNTGCLVGEIGFGGWTLGGPDGLAPDEDTAVALVRAAVARGAGFIDTADSYGNGRSERLIGRAVEDRREHALIATKGGLVERDGVLVRDFSPQHLSRAAEESRERLRSAYIDIYQLHHPTPADLQDPILWETLSRLMSDGVIRHIGVAAASPAVALTALADSRVETLQIPLNVCETEMLPVLIRARQAGVGVIARAPLMAGLLAGAYPAGQAFAAADPRNAWPAARLQVGVAFAARLRNLAIDTGRSPVQLALGWVLAQEEVAVTIPGARDLAQLEENVAASDLPLPTPRQLASLQHLQLVGVRE